MVVPVVVLVGLAALVLLLTVGPVVAARRVGWEAPDSVRAGFVQEVQALGGSNDFRVNGPDAATGPHRDRWEAQQDGVLTIDVPEACAGHSGAELQLELWGGHPGVARKRVTVNDGPTYLLPEVGAADEHCTYSYPVTPLDGDVVQPGRNTFAFACDTGTAFWGHYLIRTACLRLLLDADHAVVAAAGLSGWTAGVRSQASAEDPDLLTLALDCPPDQAAGVAAVTFWAHYHGYDENGDGRGCDWHGFSKDGEPVGHIGTATAASGWRVPFALHMIPREEPIHVRARVHFHDLPGLVYETAACHVAGARQDGRVRQIGATDLPRPFWSRADQERSCTLRCDVDPAAIERAELHVVIWDGGRGTVEAPVTLNGHALVVAGTGQHDVLYRVVPVDPDRLVQGDNVVRVRSDTEHHGIEVLAPGPALVLRLRAAARPETA